MISESSVLIPVVVVLLVLAGLAPSVGKAYFLNICRAKATSLGTEQLGGDLNTEVSS